MEKYLKSHKMYGFQRKKSKTQKQSMIFEGKTF